MAGKIPDLELTPRTGTGKGAARQARRDGLVPGVVYGGGEEPQAISIPFNMRNVIIIKASQYMSYCITFSNIC